MPKKKYYNPQDDVIKIVDGKRVPVKAYDMYKAMHEDPMKSLKSKPAEKTKQAEQTKSTNEKPKTQSEQKPENKQTQNSEEKAPDLSLHFDGEKLTLIQQRGDITTEYSVPAVSGEQQKDGSFIYTKESQRIKNVGPHPEGVYSVNGDGIFYRKKNTLRNNLYGYFGGGKFPGGSTSWGIGKLEINMTPEQQAETGRKDTTIHGGKAPGSRGCIDVVCNDENFFNVLGTLGKGNKNIPLIVDYSNTPEKVWYPANTCNYKKK